MDTKVIAKQAKKTAIWLAYYFVTLLLLGLLFGALFGASTLILAFFLASGVRYAQVTYLKRHNLKPPDSPMDAERDPFTWH